MKKVFKRTTSIVIAAILGISMLFAVHAMPGEAPIEDGIFFVEDLFDDEEFIRVMDGHLEAVLGADFMRNHREGSVLADRIEATFPIKESPGRFSDFDYPDFFGGLYFNEDGNLVVLVVALETLTDHAVIDRDVTRQANDLMAMTASGGGIIREVEYPLSYLHSIWYPISYILMEHHGHPIASNIYSIGADIRRNRVTVELFEYSEEHVSLFREFLGDSPAFEFSPAPAPEERFFGPGCISYVHRNPQAICEDSYKSEYFED